MLTQQEFDALHSLKKYLDIPDNEIIWPTKGTKLTLKCYSIDDKEQFEITITTSKIKVTKATFQQLYSDKTILFRIDMDGPRHLNPNGEFIECPHIHIYKEGAHDKWAYPLQNFISIENQDLQGIFLAFLTYINIIKLPTIKAQLELLY